MRTFKRLGILAAILCLPPLAAGVAPALATPAAEAQGAGDAAEQPAGEQIFLASKCNLCHSIESREIERTTKSEKIAGPDLSNVGSTHLAPWIAQYLQKKVSGADGKEHSKEFKGSEEDLDELAGWLATLKTE